MEHSDRVRKTLDRIVSVGFRRCLEQDTRILAWTSQPLPNRIGRIRECRGWGEISQPSRSILHLIKGMRRIIASSDVYSQADRAMQSETMHTIASIATEAAAECLLLAENAEYLSQLYAHPEEFESEAIAINGETD